MLHTFTGGADGLDPTGGLVQDPAGNLYGTTYAGGGVFKLDQAGRHFKVLYTFKNGSDGENPAAGLIRDPVGNLYGTTQNGGNASSSCPFGSTGCGVVFKVDPSGIETVLYAFSGGPDGSEPLAGLFRDSFGSLYGTAGAGGDRSSSCGNGATYG